MNLLKKQNLLNSKIKGARVKIKHLIITLLYLFVTITGTGLNFIARAEQISNSTDTNSDVALIGDSITFGWQGTRSHLSLGLGGGGFIQPWKNKFGSYNAVNFGISGDKVESVLWRIEHGLFDNIRPKAVVMLIGTNNVQEVTSSGIPAESVSEGIKLCVENIRYKSPKSQIIIVSILPRDTVSNDNYKNSIAINKITKEYLAGKNGVQVLDMWDDFLLTDGSGEINKSLYSDGSLHLNESGYAVYANRLSQVLIPILQGNTPALSDTQTKPTYAYMPYNVGLMDSQIEGWPLTTQEATYVTTTKEYYTRKPGSESGISTSINRYVWPSTPTARQYRGNIGFNPWVEVIHTKTLDEARVAAGLPIVPEPAPAINPISAADEKVILTQNGVMPEGLLGTSPNGMYSVSLTSGGIIEIKAQETKVWNTVLTSDALGSTGSIKTPKIRLTSGGNLLVDKPHNVSGNWAFWASGTYQGGEKDNYYCTINNKGEIVIYKGISPSGVKIGTLNPSTAKETFPITIQNSPNGTVAIAGSIDKAEANAMVTLNLTPSAGYRVKPDSIKLNGNTITAAYGNVAKFVMPAGNAVITAEFELLTAKTITVATMKNGSITVGNGITSAKSGDNITLTVVPSSNYRIKQNIIICNNLIIPVTNNTATFKMIDENVVLKATFESLLASYGITINPATLNGTITANGGATSAIAGSQVTVSVVPASGYKYVEGSLKYTISGSTPVAIENKTFLMPAANITITADFAVYEEPKSGWITVNDNDARITYFSSNSQGSAWTSVSDAVALNGTRSYCNKVDSHMEFTFTGTAVKLIGSYGPNRGIIDVYIDGVLDKTVDMKQAESKSQQEVYIKTGLQNKQHTIKAIVKDEDPTRYPNTYFSLEGVLFYKVDGTTVIEEPKWVTVDDRDTAVTYSGTWVEAANPNSLLGTRKYSNNTGAYIEYHFIGTGVKLIADKGGNRGQIDVYIDGVLYSTVNMNGLPVANQEVFVAEKGTLTPSEHTIKAVVRGDGAPNNYFSFEGLIYYFDKVGTGDPTYPVKIGNTLNGKIEVRGGMTQVVENAVVTLLITPNEGYRLKSGTLKQDGALLTVTGDTAAFNMPAKEVNITAEFEPIPVHSITASALNGAIKVKDGITGAKPDTRIDLTVLPKDGYLYKSGSLKVNGRATAVTNGEASFNMPDEAVTITAEFEEIKLSNITILNNPIKYNVNSALVALQHITNKITLTGNDFTIIDVNKDNSITVADALIILQYTTGKATPPSSNNGTVTVKDGLTSALTGDTITLNIVPNNGYVISVLKYNGVTIPVTNNSSSFIMPATDVTIEAEFIKEAPVIALKTYYVSNIGNDSSDGTIENPFKTIQKAADTMVAGDTCIIRGGVYREKVVLKNSGNAENARITYKAYEGETPIIKGSEIVTNWVGEGNGVWKIDLPDNFFTDAGAVFNPFKTLATGACINNKLGMHLGLVFLDGNAYKEEQTLEGCKSNVGTFYAAYNSGTTTIYTNFGKDPNSSVTEVIVRDACIMSPTQSKDGAILGLGYITLSGLTMKQASPQWTGNAGDQQGIITARLASKWIIENCYISDTPTTGISLANINGSKNMNFNDYGFNIVRNNTIERCGEAGINGHRIGHSSLIEGNLIQDINWQQRLSGAEQAGIKLHWAVDSVIKNNIIRRVYANEEAISAIWLDWACQGARVTGNVIYDVFAETGFPKQHYLVYSEANNGPIVMDNNVLVGTDGFYKGFYLAGAAFIFTHNLVVNANMYHSNADERGDQIMLPHSFDVVGTHNVATPLLRVNRNNIYLKSTTNAGENPDVNLGTNAMCETTQNFSITDTAEGLKISFEADNSILDINAPLISYKYVGKFEVNGIEKYNATDKLVSQGMENPDGTPYDLAFDMTGSQRSTSSPKVGPIENLALGTNTITFKAGVK